MESKEVRFGIVESRLFATITTTFTTGSVNAMHDSLTPIGDVPAFSGMMLQCVFGGKGVGFLNTLVYGLIAVFVAGLMVGHTPDFLGNKIERPEIILISLTLLIHPLMILASSAWSMVVPYGVRVGQRRHARVLGSAVRISLSGGQQRFRIRRPEHQ